MGNFKENAGEYEGKEGSKWENLGQHNTLKP